MDSASRPLPIQAQVEGTPFKAKLADFRDTAVVLSIHLAFRVAMILRRWNY